MAGAFRTVAALVLAAVTVCSISGSAGQQDPPRQPEPQQPAPEPQPGDQPPPVFRADINFVRVDVIATDKSGRTVPDLQPDDFEILEDDRPQKIETFRYIELNGGLTEATPPRVIRTDADEQAEAARDDVRLFGIFLDDYHVRRESSLVSRQELARFVETQLGPTDMIALMYPLDPVTSLRFTRNHDAVRRGLLQFLGRKFDYQPRNALEQTYAYYPTEIVERIRNQVSLSALESLIVHMGGLKEGRKALVLVSEGYSNILPPQLRNPIADMPGLGNPARNNPDAAVNDLTESRAQALARFDMDQQLRELFTVANRYNVSIYAVDPRGLSTGEFSIEDNVGFTTSRDYLNSSLDTLRVLSDQTDGRAVVSRNDLTLAMKQIVTDSSAYYLIGYTSAEAPTDGKFHEIKVRVKRPGTQVRARRGYWALTRDDVARATAPPKPALPQAVETALAAINYPTRARLIRTWIGTDRGENGRTRVTFVWEPVPRVPGAVARSADTTPVRVSLTAVGQDGQPLFRGRVPDTQVGSPAPVRPAGLPTSPAAGGPAGSRVTFDVPPGSIQLRLSVEAADAEVLDSERREIAVPDLTGPDAVFGTPQIFRARTVRDVEQLKGNPDAVPTATREFTRADRLLIRCTVHAPGNAPMVTAQLLNRTGQAMSQVPVTLAGAGGALIDFPLATLPPGEYLIELKAAGGSGDVKELVGFRVTG
jgi:VWFA-related protein